MPPPSGYAPTPPPYWAGRAPAPGWAAPGRTDGLAVAGLVCGIASIPLTFFCLVGVVPGVLGVVFGLVAIGRIGRSGGALAGRGMALAGAICGAVGIGLSVLWLVLVIATS